MAKISHLFVNYNRKIIVFFIFSLRSPYLLLSLPRIQSRICKRI